METNVANIILLIFLNGYCQGENAKTTAIRNQHKPEVINKLMPQQVYTVSNGVPNVNPALNVRLNNGVHNVPRIVVPIVTQHPGVKLITPNQPKEADCNNVPAQTISKDEKAKENIPEIKATKSKGPQFSENGEQDTKTGTKTLRNETTSQATSNEQKSKDAKKTENNQPKDTEKTTEQDNLSKSTPAVSKDIKTIPLDASKIEVSPKTESQTVEKNKQESNERKSNDSAEDDAKSSRTSDGDKDYTFTIYKLNDENKYSKAFNNQPNMYTDSNYLNNPTTSNVIIKNQDIEEMCERGQDIISPYQPDPYINQHFQQPVIYHTYSNYYPQNTPLDYGTSKYQYQSEGNYNTNSGMEWPNNPKDKIWRNWKSTEIYISKYEPVENTFNNGYFRSNGFNTPFINGGVIGNDYRNPNTPYSYQCHLDPMYKYMYKIRILIEN